MPQGNPAPLNPTEDLAKRRNYGKAPRRLIHLYDMG
jgi:hypothetical protein